jgi:hypothetical protein
MPNKLIKAILGISCAIIFLLSACGGSPVDRSESGNPKTTVHDITPKEELPEVPSTEKPKESEKPKSVISENIPPDSAEEEPAREKDSEDIEWGQEIGLAEMIEKAKSGEIREIEWHVMPNVLRAQAWDHRIFHLKNEDKGVDLRNTLMSAGVKIGEGGVIFRHVF